MVGRMTRSRQLIAAITAIIQAVRCGEGREITNGSLSALFLWCWWHELPPLATAFEPPLKPHACSCYVSGLFLRIETHIGFCNNRIDMPIPSSRDVALGTKLKKLPLTEHLPAIINFPCLPPNDQLVRAAKHIVYSANGPNSLET